MTSAAARAASRAVSRKGEFMRDSVQLLADQDELAGFRIAIDLPHRLHSGARRLATHALGHLRQLSALLDGLLAPSHLRLRRHQRDDQAANEHEHDVDQIDQRRLRIFGRLVKTRAAPATPHDCRSQRVSASSYQRRRSRPMMKPTTPAASPNTVASNAVSMASASKFKFPL